MTLKHPRYNTFIFQHSSSHWLRSIQLCLIHALEADIRKIEVLYCGWYKVINITDNKEEQQIALLTGSRRRNFLEAKTRHAPRCARRRDELTPIFKRSAKAWKELVFIVDV